MPWRRPRRSRVRPIWERNGIFLAKAGCRLPELVSCASRELRRCSGRGPEIGLVFRGRGPGPKRMSRASPSSGKQESCSTPCWLPLSSGGEKVYIANAVKCRPGNRTPGSDELLPPPVPGEADRVAAPPHHRRLGRPAAATMLGEIGPFRHCAAIAMNTGESPSW